MTSPPRGRLVALEGIDGCGKSTQAELLADHLGAAGVAVVRTFEPGATRLGLALRALLLDPGRPGDPAPSVRAEALLMAADRAQHVEETIEPALAGGRWVVTDRFVASTLAYQGRGRQLGTTDLAPVVRWAAGGLEADLNVLVDVPVAVARARLAGTAPDRLEQLGTDFHQRVRDGFAELARDDPARWLVVDGEGPVAAVAAAVAAGVEAHLGRVRGVPAPRGGDR